MLRMVSFQHVVILASTLAIGWWHEGGLQPASAGRLRRRKVQAAPNASIILPGAGAADAAGQPAAAATDDCQLSELRWVAPKGKSGSVPSATIKAPKVADSTVTACTDFSGDWIDSNGGAVITVVQSSCSFSSTTLVGAVVNGTCGVNAINLLEIQGLLSGNVITWTNGFTWTKKEVIVALDVTAAYGEMSFDGEEADAKPTSVLYTALGTHVAAVGMLSTPDGRSAVMRIRGVASDVELLESGPRVEVRRTPAPPGMAGTVFRGLDIFSALGDGFRGKGTRTLAFVLRLTAEVDEYGISAQTWRGWPRSLPVRLEAFFRSSSEESWRLLAVVRTYVVTNGEDNSGGFLGNVVSMVEGLTPSSCQPSLSVRFGPTRFAEVSSHDWRTFSAAAAVTGSFAVWDGMSHNLTMLKQPIDKSVPPVQVPLIGASLPSLLMGYPDAQADFVSMPEGVEQRPPIEDEQHRFDRWGMHFDRKKDTSCLKPDFKAVQSDPLQAAPDPNAPLPDVSHLCPVLPAEHFWWHPPATKPTPPEADDVVEWFYNEITVEVSGPSSYFMSTGFLGGYMGIQEHADPAHRFAIFSVWDAATKVEILDWGDGVTVGRFGAEGTGANSFRPYAWELGKTVRFLVRAQREPPLAGQLVGTTAFTGYIHDDITGVWKMMATFRVRPCGAHADSGGLLTGFNSFLEVFESPPVKPKCENYGETRVARYGPAFYSKSQTGDGHGPNFGIFPNVSLSATCMNGDGSKDGPKRCPTTGLDYYEHLGSFVLTVGKTIQNDGHLPMGTPQLVAQRPPPDVIAKFPLPSSDNSHGGEFKPRNAEVTSDGRPLSHWGKSSELSSWGSGGRTLECPWYVIDCTG